MGDAKRIEFYGAQSDDEVELQIYAFLKEVSSKIEAVCVTQNSKWKGVIYNLGLYIGVLTRDQTVWIIARETGSKFEFKVPSHIEVEYSGKLLSAKPGN